MRGRMAQTKDEAKRIAIRDAVITDVVENGIGNAPVSLIAKRAGVSAGTIYIYYPNKDEMLQSIFLEIKSMLHDAMMAAAKSGASSEDCIRLMWFALFRFILEHPDMFAFHEAVSAEKILSSDQREDVVRMAGDVHRVLRAAVNDGTLKDIPIDGLVSLLIAPATSLARRMLASGSQDGEVAEQVFQAIWIGIAKPS